MYVSNEPTWQKELINKIAKELKLDIRVVREIAYYPLLFLKNVIEDDENERPVRIRKLGAWTVRSNKSKIVNLRKRAEWLIENAEFIWDKIDRVNGGTFTSKEEFIRNIKYLLSRKHNMITVYERRAKEAM